MSVEKQKLPKFRDDQSINMINVHVWEVTFNTYADVIYISTCSNAKQILLLIDKL